MTVIVILLLTHHTIVITTTTTIITVASSDMITSLNEVTSAVALAVIIVLGGGVWVGVGGWGWWGFNHLKPRITDDETNKRFQTFIRTSTTASTAHCEDEPQNISAPACRCAAAAIPCEPWSKLLSRAGAWAAWDFYPGPAFAVGAWRAHLPVYSSDGRSSRNQAPKYANVTTRPPGSRSGRCSSHDVPAHTDIE